jgi:cell shape-determining protein MreC
MFGLSNRRGAGERHAAGGGDLEQRVAALEEAVQENRALNVRLAELTDVVSELLLPVAARDEKKLEELLGKYRGDFS